MTVAKEIRVELLKLLLTEFRKVSYVVEYEIGFKNPTFRGYYGSTHVSGLCGLLFILYYQERIIDTYEIMIIQSILYKYKPEGKTNTSLWFNFDDPELAKREREEFLINIIEKEIGS